MDAEPGIVYHPAPMKLRSLLPLLAAAVLAGSGSAQTSDDTSRLMRDLRTVMQQRDTLIEQAAQANRERDALKTQLANVQTEADALKQKVTASADQTAAATATDQALREAQMKADMTVRAFAIKEEEAAHAVQAANLAAQKQADAEHERDAAVAEAKRLTAEAETAKKAEAAALAARAQMQNELYAAQIRIDNLARAIAAHGGTVALPPPPLAPTPVAVEVPAPAPAPKPETAKADQPAAPTGPRTHTVADGETLSLLAFKYYGSPNKWDKIFDANRDKLKNPDQVRPGMTLKIP